MIKIRSEDVYKTIKDDCFFIKFDFEKNFTENERRSIAKFVMRTLGNGHLYTYRTPVGDYGTVMPKRSRDLLRTIYD